ncbi:MAG: hypothetical protein AABX99_02715 [Nanoarchaeota archaeon]
METATRKQKRMIKRLKLEKIVPLNVSPENIDSLMSDLETSSKITHEQYLDYFCKARWQRSHVPTVWSTVKSLIGVYTSFSPFL